MEGFNDPRGMGMSHVGWGLNQERQVASMVPGEFPGGMGMEARSFYGNVMFSLAQQRAGGPNDTACHLDIPMRGCSLFLGR